MYRISYKISMEIVKTYPPPLCNECRLAYNEELRVMSSPMYYNSGYLNNNQLKKLPPGIFSNNTQLRWLCNELDRDILAIRVRLGSLCRGNSGREASVENASSVKVRRCVEAFCAMRALDLTAEKGSIVWLTVLPPQESGFNLNKQEFLDVAKLSKYSLQNDPRDLAAELLSTVYGDVEVDTVLQDISGEQLKRGADRAKGARLNLHARGFCEQQRSAFPDVKVCHPNAESYKNIEPQQIYRMHQNEKNSQYSRRVLEIEP
ncbi:hypothetical protein AWC38_SpisGene21797 [Stylophora pistillata]|uniref:Uncharacterized protein n=1 Tax=Stylophora pistillata TaxID=50429 RepID=A0A2B4RB94_STYPI|nr:hypothetical protein AWC38_SpisGene21797 [Stylophora pistillata]